MTMAAEVLAALSHASTPDACLINHDSLGEAAKRGRHIQTHPPSERIPANFCSAMLVRSSHSHSQKTTTRCPLARRARTARRSLRRFALNFRAQNARLLFGIVARLHPRCAFQMQPWTKMRQPWARYTKDLHGG